MAETTQVAEQAMDNQNSPPAATQADPPVGEVSLKADSKTHAQAADFPEAADAGSTGAGGSIDILLDMNIPVTVTIGTTQIPIRRLLQLGPGSVVKLNKPVDTPVDLYLKDTRFATGTVVVADGRFGVRIKQIFAASEPKPGQSSEQG